MKYQKILGLVATAGLFLAGCTTDSDTQNTWFSDPSAVRISASVGSTFTRSNPTAGLDEGLKSFNSGDKIGVTSGGTSVIYSFDGTDWLPGSNTDYLVWDTKNMSFQCWYPADGKNSFEKGYIQADQSDAQNIVNSDYMAAEIKPASIPEDKVLKVELERKTARLILKISHFNAQFANVAKIDHVNIISKASTDASETSTVTINPFPVAGEASEIGKVGTTYTALVAPGAIEAQLYLPSGEAATTPLVVKTSALEAGKSYTYNLIVGKDAVTIDDMTVAEWKPGETTGGEALERPDYLTFTADAYQYFRMACTGEYELSGLEYSVNFGEWKKYTSGTSVTFGGKYGDLRLRGTNVTGTAENEKKYATINLSRDVKVKCTGDIRTLLDYNDYKNVNTANARFCYLFYKCAALTSVPKLPAKDLADRCYHNMFAECTAIEKAPELPATKLKEYCYYCMFDGCTALTEVPDLPAEDLPEQCYHWMFLGCKELVKGPKISAATISQYSCYGMFSSCAKLSSVALLMPNDEIEKNVPYGLQNWLGDNTGTSATTRTLVVKDKAAYDALKSKSYLPSQWQIGSSCTVLDESGNPITE
ncbi:fimbrillin family protein [Segatella copri]|uniref:fimbrillin family protein n=1 Tax=Segatella copri TaxID=165179 RepID=UPI00294B5A8E|nr:fimbrillin family protein [Segatella copri]WOF87513.1 fimbrillin family protein [Segatella copri]WOF93983.1 fimbrillin family protein [Segatella copri]